MVITQNKKEHFRQHAATDFEGRQEATASIASHWTELDVTNSGPMRNKRLCILSRTAATDLLIDM